MKIAMEPVKSSNLAAAGYDAASRTLAVRFTSGRVYHYEGVEPAVYDELRGAESVGRYFAQNIRPAFEGRPQESDE